MAIFNFQIRGEISIKEKLKMKKAVLVVSFGTSYHETRKKTIEVCERKIS